MEAGRRRVAPIQRASAPAVTGVGLVMQAPRQWFRAQWAAGENGPGWAVPAGSGRHPRQRGRGCACSGLVRSFTVGGDVQALALGFFADAQA